MFQLLQCPVHVIA